MAKSEGIISLRWFSAVNEYNHHKDPKEMIGSMFLAHPLGRSNLEITLKVTWVLGKMGIIGGFSLVCVSYRQCCSLSLLWGFYYMGSKFLGFPKHPGRKQRCWKGDNDRP